MTRNFATPSLGYGEGIPKYFSQNLKAAWPFILIFLSQIGGFTFFLKQSMFSRHHGT
jgi:hypothetical protein